MKRCKVRGGNGTVMWIEWLFSESRTQLREQRDKRGPTCPTTVPTSGSTI